MSEIKPFPGGRGKTPTFHALELDTLQDSRRSYARLIEAYATGQTSESQTRTIAYLLGGYLQYLKMEADLRIEERLTAIEDELLERPK